MTSYEHKFGVRHRQLSEDFASMKPLDFLDLKILVSPLIQMKYTSSSILDDVVSVLFLFQAEWIQLYKIEQEQGR